MEHVILFVHGYSVTNLNTYGGLPARLENEGVKRGLDLSLLHIFLGRYISFNDELTLDDISRAFNTALYDQLVGNPGKKIIVIAHSTGGPVIRNWFHLFYGENKDSCPVSHLIMLAPPNHGSALAQLGKGKLSRIRAWLDGAEPGEKILDWLELGSMESWLLNLNWIRTGEKFVREKQCWFFVLIGQDIDRKMYDHVNSYTGEVGSDGVVRVSSANINSRYLFLKQVESSLKLETFSVAPGVPMRIVSKKAHSNEDMGIMKSVRPDLGDSASAETIDAIFNCINVNTFEDYKQLEEKFRKESNEVQINSRLEVENRGLFKKRYIHDRQAMIVFRVRDQENNWLSDYDLVLTGANNDPDLLPPGFLTDRQFNFDRGSLTFYLNYDLIKGCNAVVDENGKEIRKAMDGIKEMGLIIRSRPEQGMVHYRSASFPASREFMEVILQPNSTTLLEIEVNRFVSKEVFRFEDLPEGNIDIDFKDTRPGTGFIV